MDAGMKAIAILVLVGGLLFAAFAGIMLLGAWHADRNKAATPPAKVRPIEADAKP